MKIAFKNGKILMINGRTLTSVHEPEPPEPPEPSFDEVTIGTQTWMAKNLSIDDGGEGIYTQTVNYGQGDVVEYYYTWGAAVRVAASIDGWHLPTQEEWNTLSDALGSDVAGTKLKSSYGWSYGNGTDDYGFAALPAGQYNGESIVDFGTLTKFWSITDSPWGSDWHYVGQLLAYSNILDITIDWTTQVAGNSVRLVKDS
jgi:uncharacterized protein (TIGR02145 family)